MNGFALRLTGFAHWLCPLALSTIVMSISLSFSKRGECQSFRGLYRLLPNFYFGKTFEFFDRLGKDVQFIILRHLPWTNLLSCKVVSKSWRALIHNPLCWKNFCLEQHRYTATSLVTKALLNLPAIRGFICDVLVRREEGSTSCSMHLHAIKTRCKYLISKKLYVQNIYLNSAGVLPLLRPS